MFCTIHTLYRIFSVVCYLALIVQVLIISNCKCSNFSSNASLHLKQEELNSSQEYPKEIENHFSLAYLSNITKDSLLQNTERSNETHLILRKWFDSTKEETLEREYNNLKQMNIGTSYQENKYFMENQDTVEWINNTLNSTKNTDNLKNFEEVRRYPNISDNLLVIEEENDNPDTALSGFYSECLLYLSIPCLQRKMLVYIDKLDRKSTFGLFDEYLSVVKLGNNSRILKKLSEENLVEPRMSVIDSIRNLDSLLDYSIGRFLSNRAIRVKMPSWSLVGIAGSQQMAPQGSAVKLSLSPPKFEEDRGHSKDEMKIAATAVKMLMIGKGMMIPMIMGMTKLMGMKGMLMGIMSMIMTKMTILSKLKKSGGLGMPCGGGGSGGCGGGMLSMMGLGGGD